MYRAEQWIQAVAKESGQRVDWHYSGGRVNVLYLGDHAKVVAAITKLTPDLLAPMAKDPLIACRCGSAKEHDQCSLLSRIYPPESDDGPYRAI